MPYGRNPGISYVKEGKICWYMGIFTNTKGRLYSAGCQVLLNEHKKFNIIWLSDCRGFLLFSIWRSRVIGSKNLVCLFPGRNQEHKLISRGNPCPATLVVYLGYCGGACWQSLYENL
jgi:hypothetical protein